MVRKISREDALDRAITQFWDYGYRGTSMEMLTQALGVEKPSIYSNFGSKKDLFLEALDSYRVMLKLRMSATLARGANAREGLEHLITEMMTPSNAVMRRGCLATNSALEIADLDPEIRSRIRDTFNDVLELFTQAIRQGQQEGDIRDDRSAGALAHFLFTCFGGVRILEKTSIETPHWSEAARLAFSVLGVAGQRQRSKSAPSQGAKAGPRRRSIVRRA